MLKGYYCGILGACCTHLFDGFVTEVGGEKGDIKAVKDLRAKKRTGLGKKS